MNELQIAEEIYKHFVGKIDSDTDSIPIDMRAPSLVGTVQDDPFDTWTSEVISENLSELDIHHAGKLTTPDIAMRHPVTKSILGLEVKKLIQKRNGADPRGLTIDYNSSIPCGQALIRIKNDHVAIPCFYFFALLSPDSSSIVTLLLIDGDFLNYDFDLHKDAKTANISEYNQGPYGEGSVRRRAMYTYPNPLNYKLDFFHLRKVMVVKSNDAEKLGISDRATHQIRRDDIYGNQFFYSIIDFTVEPTGKEPPLLTDIFVACKKRSPKKRTQSMITLT